MKVVIKLAVLGIIAVSAVGCSTIKTDELNSNESTGLKDKSLVFSKYNKLPDFPAQTAVNVQFGLLGLATANANGNSMIRNNHIEDPAIEISRKLAKGLQENRGMKLAEETTDFVASHELADIVKAYSQYDYILDVKTLGWNSIYYV